MPKLVASVLSRWRHPGTDALSEYLDGMLPPRRQGQVERHLASCESCQAELDSLRITVSLLQRVPQVEPSRSFVFAAPAAASPLVERPRRVQGSPNWVFAAAGASLAMLLAVLVSADMVGVLKSDGIEVGQEVASEISMDEAPVAQAAVHTTAGAPQAEAIDLLTANAPLPASAATPTPPAVQRYTGKPVKPIEEMPIDSEETESDLVLAAGQADDFDLLSSSDDVSSDDVEIMGLDAKEVEAQLDAQHAEAETLDTTTKVVATAASEAGAAPVAPAVMDETPTPAPTIAPAPPSVPSRQPSTPAATPVATAVPTASAPLGTPGPMPDDKASPASVIAVSGDLIAVDEETALPTPEPVPQRPAKEKLDREHLGEEKLDERDEGSTNVWWRVLEGLLAVLAIIVLGLFFWRWRRGRAA